MMNSLIANMNRDDAPRDITPMPAACWAALRLKDVFYENSRGQPCNTVLSLSYGKVIIKNFSNKMGVVPDNFDSYQGVFPGDVILRLTDLQNDQKSLRVGRAVDYGIITSAYLSVRPRGMDSRFSAFLLHDLGDIQKIFYGLGGGVRQSMKFKDLCEVNVSIPPLPKQIAIADYLDKTTALIDKQRALLERKKALLQEHKKALIHEAVTKGLTPGVAMKSSGVDWIGDMPKNWKIARLKDVMYTAGGSARIKNSCSYFPRQGLFPAFSASGQDVWVESPDFKKEGIVVSSVGSRCGKCFIAEFDAWSSIANTQVLFLKSSGESVRFYWYVLNNESFWDKDGTAQPFISMASNLQKQIAVPSAYKQFIVVNYLDEVIGNIQKQWNLLDKKLNLLGSLRTSIVHDAVTRGVPE